MENAKNTVQPVVIADFTAKAEALLNKGRKLLENNDLACEKMPCSAFDGDKPVSLVFAGQYSAGKSTILKALTGIKDIATGEGITTQEAHGYNWNGIEVIDTPGIHTTLRPDHDEISYKAIANSDLLVYVVTQELFDDFIGQNFRKLIIDNDKAAETILVVNKMADVGNTEELRNIKLKDLEKVTSPYTPQQLRTVFIDAQSYIYSFSAEDRKIADELRKRSNFDEFIEALNNFVAEKQLCGKMTKSLYSMCEVLDDAMSSQRQTDSDDIESNIEEDLRRQRKMLLDEKSVIETEAKSVYEEAAGEIYRIGQELASNIADYKAEEQQTAVSDTCAEAERIAENCWATIGQRIAELSEQCKAEWEKYFKSDFYQKFNLLLQSKTGKNEYAKYLAKGSGTAKDIAQKLQNAGGINLNVVVEETGTWVSVKKFFGYTPKKIVTDELNTLGKVVQGAAILGTGLEVVSQFVNDVEKERYETELRKQRAEIRAYFNDMAQGLKQHYKKRVAQYLSESCDKPIEEKEAAIAEIRNSRQNKTELEKALEKMHADCITLISEIHHNCGLEADGQSEE